MEETRKANFPVIELIWKELRKLSVFRKAFKTNTSNELGSFLESFNIVKEKNKWREPFSYVQFSNRESIFPISDTKFHALKKLHTEEN